MVKQRSVRGSDGAWRIAENTDLPAGQKLLEKMREAGANTIPRIVEFSAKKNSNRPCMGTRTLIHRSIEEVDGVKHEKLELGDYVWETYSQVYEKTLKVAASLLGMGFKPNSRIAIFAETRADWFTMAVGCLRAGVTLATLYTNLNDYCIVHGVNETLVDTVIASYDLLPRFCALLPQMKNVKRVIVFEDQLEGIGNPTQMCSSVSFTSFYSLLLNADLKMLDDYSGPSQDDIAIIMYTSGSSGNPKGVLLSHKNMHMAVTSYPVKVNVKPGDCYLAYLPLPHVMELCSEVALMSLGISIAYSSPLTITGNSPKIMKGTVGDAKLAQPTFINAVPLILDRIIKGVLTNVEKQGKLKAKTFHEALKLKQMYKNGATASLLNLVVFNKVKAELGGKMRLVITGGAPLSIRTFNIFTAMFDCDIKSGYGSTETTASTSLMDCDDNVPCTTGSPNKDVSVLLEDWVEGGYKTSDKPHPRGEVLVGGDMVAVGYLNLPEETKQAFVERNGIRYFRTGDIGEFDDRGVLSLIDRKKDLVKLQQGEYVALGSIETRLKTHVLVDNICVFADPNESYVVAIVVPSPEMLLKLAISIGKSDKLAFNVLCRDKQVVQAVLHELVSHARKQNLTKAEVPKKLYLTADLWNPESGLVTSAFKLRRKPLSMKYNGHVTNMYASG